MPRKTAALPAVAEPVAAAQPSELTEILDAVGLAAPAGAIEYRELPLGRVLASPLNPRKSRGDEGIEALARSIGEKGLLQPILVRPSSQLDIEGQHFDIIHGERRHAASALAVARGWLPADYQIPARIRACDDDELVLLAAIENLAREDMTPLDEAELYALLRPRVSPNDGETREAAIARLFNNSVSERTVFRRLALLRLVPEAQVALAAKEISLGQAQALALGAEHRQREVLGRGPDELPDAEDIREHVLDDRPPVTEAVFDLALYSGEIVDDTVTGERFFADRHEFERLQLAALEARAEALRQRGKWQWVEVVPLDGSFWQGYCERDPSTYEDWKPADPGVGAVVMLVEGYHGRTPKIEVKAPVMRKAEAEAAVKARQRGTSPGEPAEAAARDPLSKVQQATLHAAKTRTMRRAVAGDPSLATALAIIGLLGAREVRLGSEGYPIGPAVENRIDSPTENIAAIGALLDRARGPRLPRDQKALAGTWKPHEGLDLKGDAAQLAWLDAIMELPGPDMNRLFALLVAERIGSWYLPVNQGYGGVAEIGDTPLAVGIAGWCTDVTVTSLRQVDREDWAPDAEFFKGYPKDRLLDLARILNVKLVGQGRAPHNLAGIRKSELVDLLAAEPAGFWTPDLFPETRFQSEKAARAAIVGDGVPLAALLPHQPTVRDQESGIRDQAVPLDAVELMRAGRELRRDATTKRFYVDGKGGLTDGQVKRLEDKGLLRRVGVDTYALAEVEPQPEPQPETPAELPVEDALDADPVAAAEREVERQGSPT